jgi:hypothetical protein
MSLTLSPLLTGCQGPNPAEESSPEAAQAPLADGFYVVLAKGKHGARIHPAAGEALAVNRHRYAPRADQEPVEYLLLHDKPDVPLTLASPPEAVQNDSGGIRIHLALAREQASAVDRLTRRHLGAQVAILIGGEVVTVHKIRQVIHGGRIQISCCEEGSCEYLLKRLREQVR